MSHRPGVVQGDSRNSLLSVKFLLVKLVDLWSREPQLLTVLVCVFGCHLALCSTLSLWLCVLFCGCTCHYMFWLGAGGQLPETWGPWTEVSGQPHYSITVPAGNWIQQQQQQLQRCPPPLPPWRRSRKFVCLFWMCEYGHCMVVSDWSPSNVWAYSVLCFFVTAQLPLLQPVMAQNSEFISWAFWPLDLM